MNGIHLEHLLILSTGLFFIGLYGFCTRRNTITVLMSVELILNAVNINFIAFNHYLYPENNSGLFFAIFIIAIAAAEAAIAIAIIINLYRQFRSVDIDDTDTMKL
jgi:NAD(P)H-quinone oxidoreductase subunit 4L